MAENLTIPDKTTGDQHFAAEYQAMKEWINEPSKSLGAFDPAMTFDGSGEYDDYTPTSSTTVTFTATGIKSGNTRWVKIITDGTVTFASGSGCELLSGSLGLLQAGTYKIGMGVIFGAVQIVIPGTESTPPTSLVNTHSMVIDETGEGMVFVDPNMYFSNGAGSDAPYSILLWYKTPSSIISEGSIFITNDTGGSFHQSVLLSLIGNVRVRQYGSPTTNRIGCDTDSGAINASTWYKIAITYDGSEVYTGIKIYIDEVLQAQNAANNGTYTGLAALSGNMEVEVPNPGAAYGAGKYNCLRIFDKELSLSEIQSLSSGAAPVEVPVGLQGNVVCEYMFNNNLDANVGVNGSATGAPTFDTDLPT